MKKCDGNCFNCKFSDCILSYDEVSIDERLDDFILDQEIVKRREKARQNYRENRKHIRALWDKYYYAHKDKIKEYKHKYYVKNKKRILKQQLIYERNQRKKRKEEKSQHLVDEPPIEVRLEDRFSEVKQYVEQLMKIAL